MAWKACSGAGVRRSWRLCPRSCHCSVSPKLYKLGGESCSPLRRCQEHSWHRRELYVTGDPTPALCWVLYIFPFLLLPVCRWKFRKAQGDLADSRWQGLGGSRQTWRHRRYHSQHTCTGRRALPTLLLSGGWPRQTCLAPDDLRPFWAFTHNSADEGSADPAWQPLSSPSLL